MKDCPAQNDNRAETKISGFKVCACVKLIKKNIHTNTHIYSQKFKNNDKLKKNPSVGRKKQGENLENKLKM